jgi:hypothetical protein
MTLIPEPRSEPSDATRFATTREQRAVELFNETEDDLDQIRNDAVEGAVQAILAGHPTDALYQIWGGVRDAWQLDMKRDSRHLDPAVVLATFDRAVRRHVMKAYP